MWGLLKRALITASATFGYSDNSISPLTHYYLNSYELLYCTEAERGVANAMIEASKGLDHGTGHLILFGLAHGALRWTESSYPKI